jgi:hypothetical protein
MIDYLLYTVWISWLIHFVIFYVLSKWSGIKWQWAIILVFGIEVWEMFDWSRHDLIAWWLRVDTVIDLIFGLSGVYLGNRDK